jgi:hypothetical protein
MRTRVGEPTIDRVTLARARTWTCRPVYHRMSKSGELVRVQVIERHGPDHVLYTRFRTAPRAAHRDAGERPVDDSLSAHGHIVDCLQSGGQS